MAIKGNAQAILVDEFIFNSETSSVNTSISVAELDHTNIASTATEYKTGLTEWRITQNGYFAGGDADGIADELHDRLGTTGAQVAHIIDRTSNGNFAYVIPDAFNANLPIEATAANLVTMNGEWAASDAGHRGRCVAYNASISGTGAGTSIDFGSAGSSGGYAYLFLHTIDGDDSGTSTNTDIDVESATTEGGSYSSEGTFTTSATGGTAITMSSTVNRWIRFNVTDMGGASALTATVIVCVTGVT
jgi:hypothetical protein